MSPDHDIAIYCSKTRMFWDLTSGSPTSAYSLTRYASMMTEFPQTGFNTFSGCWTDQILRTRYVMVRSMTVRARGRLAVARVGRLEDTATSVSRMIWVEHHPEPCKMMLIR